MQGSGRRGRAHIRADRRTGEQRVAQERRDHDHRIRRGAVELEAVLRRDPVRLADDHQSCIARDAAPGIRQRRHDQLDDRGHEPDKLRRLSRREDRVAIRDPKFTAKFVIGRPGERCIPGSHTGPDRRRHDASTCQPAAPLETIIAEFEERNALRFLATGADVGGAGSVFLASDLARAVTGQSLHVNAGGHFH